jgi:hypothetical protein
MRNRRIQAHDQSSSLAGTSLLVGAFTDPVPRWIVAADDVIPGVIRVRVGVAGRATGAVHVSAAHVSGGLPHHLRVVPAHLPRGARIRRVVIVGHFVRPRRHGVQRRPRGLLRRPPEQILPVLPIRVRQGDALARLRRRVRKSVVRKVGAPAQCRYSHSRPRRVVGIQILAASTRLRICHANKIHKLRRHGNHDR